MRILGHAISAKGKINFPVICKNLKNYFFAKIVTFNEFRQLVYQFDIFTLTLNQEINVKNTIFTQYWTSYNLGAWLKFFKLP